MVLNRRRMRRVLAALTLAALALVAVSQAGAQPPPPNFIKFTILNGSGAPMSQVKVEVFPSVNDHKEIAASPSAVLDVEEVPPGAVLALSLPATYGVSRIHCTGKCPGDLTGDVTITAHQIELVPGDPESMVYTAFVNTAAPEEDSNLRLVFLPPERTVHRVQLEGHARWSSETPQHHQDVQLCK